MDLQLASLSLSSSVVSLERLLPNLLPREEADWLCGTRSFFLLVFFSRLVKSALDWRFVKTDDSIFTFVIL